MRIKLKYSSKEAGLLLPLHYNSIIQALIYNTFSEEIAKFLHAEGYQHEKRHFKLFTFSRILDKGQKISGYKLNQKKELLKISQDFHFRPKRNSDVEEALYFEKGIEFYFSSPKNALIEDMASKAILNPQSMLLNQDIFISSVNVLPQIKFTNAMNIKMLSPATMYSTIKSKSGKSLTYYYSPYEEEFSRLISENARKKNFLVNGSETDGTLKITPLHFEEKRNRAVVYFKNTRIEGWTGIFTLKGEPELIKIVYEAGIGGKNPEGFGMWAPFEEKKF